MSKDKKKTMDQVIKGLNIESEGKDRRRRVMENKLKALAESARILGLDLLLIAYSPGNGAQTAVVRNNDLPKETEGDPWVYIAGLFRTLVSHFLNNDPDLILPLMDAVKSCKALKTEIKFGNLPLKDNDNE